MTDNGTKCLVIMLGLEDSPADRTGDHWFTASLITKRFGRKFGGIEERSKPVMTISGYLTHLKREGLVERQASTDKLFAWWRLTKKGREIASAQEA